MRRANKNIPFWLFLYAIFLIPFAPILLVFVLLYEGRYFKELKDIYLTLAEVIPDYIKQIFTK